MLHRELRGELQFNWKKTELMNVRTNDKVMNNLGQPVVTKESLVYLGTSLSADGRMGAELSRRIGSAKRDFQILHTIWFHSV